jgi:uncharacterized integral membrane protein
MERKPTLADQQQILIIIWAALLVSQVLFLVMLFFTKSELFNFEFSQHPLAPSWPMIVAFALAAVVCFLLSFSFKKRFIDQAYQEKKPEIVQSGFIIAIALCEACSLFGLCLAFAFDYQYFFIWFALGIVGIVAHFPKQKDLLAAGYK